MAWRPTRKAHCYGYASATVGSVNCHEIFGERPATKWQVLIDFDGTIAPDDPTDHLFERFADPYWRVLEDDWQNGRISSRECMRLQVDLLRVSPSALDEEISAVRIDQGFHAFVSFCRGSGVEVKIVSDGFDRVVRAALGNEDLNVPFFANKLVWLGKDRWRLAFPHMRADCRVWAANCKCSHGQRPSACPRVVIGDGRSDFCMAMTADFVIAKGSLADFCGANGRRYATFGNFFDATEQLSAWLSGCPAYEKLSP